MTIIKDEKTRRRLWRSIFHFADGMTYKDIAAYASSTAFFFFIAIIPFLILLSKLLPLTGISDDRLIQIVTGFTPEFTDLMVVLVVKQAYSSADSLVPISAIVMLYATARGTLSLIRGFNRVYEVKDRRNGVMMQLMAIFYTFIMVIDLVLLLAVIVFGEDILEFLIKHIKVLNRVPAIYPFRYLIFIGIGIVIFTVIYAYLPGQRQPLKKQLPGAVFTALAWVVFSFFFSLFMESSIYSTYYGSLAAVAVFMMWLYGCFYILLIGANINHSLCYQMYP